MWAFPAGAPRIYGPLYRARIRPAGLIEVGFYSPSTVRASLMVSPFHWGL